jgi:CubicO group peptidase (beta-lactamase class C family)
LPPELEGQVALGHLGDGTAVPGGWRVHPEQAAAGLWSTASDLALFAIEVRKAYQGDGELLKRSSAVELLTEQLDGEGIGLVVRGDGEELVFSHAGGNVGYRAFMVMHVASGDGAVFMTNSDLGMDVGREMLRAASAVYDWPDYKPTSVRRVVLERTALTPLEGTYDFGDGIQIVIDLEESVNQLSITFPNGDRYALVPTGAQNFVSPETGVTVDFDGADDQRQVIVYGDTGVRVRK